MKCSGTIEDHTAIGHELPLLEERNEAYIQSDSTAKLEQITAEQLHILDSELEKLNQ